jgi:hypothetical protein
VAVYPFGANQVGERGKVRWSFQGSYLALSPTTHNFKVDPWDHSSLSLSLMSLWVLAFC